MSRAPETISVSKLAADCMTRPCSTRHQPHIRSPFVRTLFVQAAHVVSSGRRAQPARVVPGSQASKRLHRNMLAIALANKLARIAWRFFARGGTYQPRITHAA